MRGRTRFLIALAFVALFALLPAPDSSTGKPYLAYLKVREWLLDQDASPLVDWAQDGRAPILQVELRQSPPIEDAGLLRSKQADYARCAVEWAAARSAAGIPTVLDPQRGTLLLQVHVGTDGVHAVLPRPGADAKAMLGVAFPSRWSLLPACLAIVIAVLTQRVLLALVLGCLAGSIAFVSTSGAATGVFGAFFGGARHFVGDAFWQRSICDDLYVRITLFVVFLFMAIGVMTRNGGVHGMVRWLQRRVTGPLSAQLCAFGTGLLIFFDDYTNCLIAGTTMRPLCDASRVSREKLAYLVDSTAAPIAGISVFSTWIAYEVSMFSTPLTLVTRPDGTPYTQADGYAVFLDTLPFRFYCLFTLLLVFLVIVLRRDFGPMLGAERRARQLGKPFADDARPLVAASGISHEPAAGVPWRAMNALLPLAVLIVGTLGIMLAQGAMSDAPRPTEPGFSAQLRFLLAHSQSDWALLIASSAAWSTTVLLSLGQRLLTLREVLLVSLRATRALGLAFGILFLAWSLGHICKDLGTSFFLTAGARGAMSAQLLPIVLFLIAGLIAFATGTSFGTMAILLPNVVVLAHQLGTDAAFTGSAAVGGTALMLLSIGAVLEGSIFGDHCSPISDTTVLSSIGSQCDHLAHVQTQMPYALLAFATAASCGYVPMVLFGPQWWPLSFVAGAGVMTAFLLVFGRNADRPAATPTNA